ncbi:MAG: ribosomal RNA small subunit methyltransferase A [Desulfobulbus sp.]|nr:MAG: ribosomal RNA small subunit methyltransferase A [Desulfobulbus sp.]
MVYQNTRAQLKKQGLAPSKKLGQNFLVHRHTAEKIVSLADVSKDDTVIEVGVGLGALTRPLADAAGQVIGIETDSGLIRLHEQEGDLPENVHLIHQDILQADFCELVQSSGGRPLQIIANLPYSISSPFLFKLIEQHQHIDYAVVMLQKEVALRLLAKSGTKEYGVPTVMMASCAETTMLMQVKPEEFHPRPKVDSVVVRLAFSPSPARVTKLGTIDYPLLKKVVNGAFGQRRKTLLNALSSTGLLEKSIMKKCITATGLEPTIRAERLELEDFVMLARNISDQKRP